MAGDGTSYEIDLPVSGTGGVNAGADALDRLAANLTVAAAASTKAAEAVKAGEQSYRAAESAADRAAKALERVNVAADAQRQKMKAAMDSGNERQFWKAAAALEALNARQSELSAKAEAAKVTLAAEAASIDKLRASAESAKAAEAALIKSQSDAVAAAKTAAAAETAAAKAREKSAVQAAKTKAEAEANAAKEAAAAARVQEATARKAQLALEKSAPTGNVNELADAFGKLGGPLGSIGQKAFGAVDGVKKLKSALGSSGAYAAAALGIAAIAAAVVALGVAAVGAIASATIWAVKLADKTGAIEKETKRLQTNIEKLFGGLKIDGLVAGISKVVDLFDETSITGRAIKVVFESLFQPIVDGLTALGPKIIATFIQFEIWVLKALIAIKPFGSTIVTVAKWVGVAGLVIGAALAAATVVILAVVAASAALVGGLFYLTNKIADVSREATLFAISVGEGIGSAIDWVVGKVNEVITFLSGLSLSEIGTQLVAGLAQGITAGGTAVLSAITGVVDGAINSAKKLLKIASPSQVFAEIGAYTAEGMAGGVEASTGAVQNSLEQMVAPPEPERAPATSSSAGGGANFAGAQFIFQGVKDAEDAVSRFEEVILNILEGKALQSGSGVPA